MRRRPWATALGAVALGLAVVGAVPAPSTAQQARPRLTVTALPNPAVTTLFGVSFPDPTHGFVVGANHTAYATTDGGQTWVRQQTPLPADRVPAAGEIREATSSTITDVAFVDAQRGFAVSTSDAILATADGGTTWRKVELPQPLQVRPASEWPDRAPSIWQFNAVSFPDELNATAVGELGTIFKTTDGGATWTYKGDPAYGRLTDVDFIDSVHGQVAGTVRTRVAGALEPYLALGTTDGGETWTPQRTGKPEDEDIPINLEAVAYGNEPRRIVAAGTGRIFVSFDGGATWRSRRSGTPERLEAVAFADKLRGLAIGSVAFPDSSGGQILATNDGGQSWHPRPTPEGGSLLDVTFADLTTAYVVGCTGGVAPCTQAAILRVDFPELQDLPEQPASSGFSPVPVILLGAAALVIFGGVRLARRLS